MLNGIDIKREAINTAAWVLPSAAMIGLTILADNHVPQNIVNSCAAEIRATLNNPENSKIEECVSKKINSQATCVLKKNGNHYCVK